jgi:hypothetical protein
LDLEKAVGGDANNSWGNKVSVNYISEFSTKVNNYDNFSNSSFTNSISVLIFSEEKSKISPAAL